MKMIFDLLAIGISGAAFFAAFGAFSRAREMEKRLRSGEKALRAELEELKEGFGILEEVNAEELAARQRREAAFLQGLQNIYNYGGEIAQLRAEETVHGR